MLKYVILCGCLMAVAHAGLIAQPAIAIRPAYATATATSNIVRGVAPLGLVGAPALWAPQPALTNLAIAPAGLAKGWSAGLGAGGW